MPIKGRVIEHRKDVLGTACLDEFLYKVASRGGVGSVVVGQSAGIVKGEAVVMARGESDVLHSCALCECGDLAGIEVFSGEGVGKLLVFVFRDMEKIHRPLSACELGIKPPVDEHSEASVFEFGYSFLRNRY